MTTPMKLARWLRVHLWTVSALAEHLGCTRQAVHKWLSGETRPTIDHAAQLEELTGIPAASWRRHAA